MTVELLYFDGCPSWQNALANLREALGGSVQVSLLAVETEADAERLQFHGSPTLRVNGQDLFPVAGTDYALGCRIYHTPDGLQGWPSTEMIRQALAENHPSFQ
jgi:hypothetical protein